MAVTPGKNATPSPPRSCFAARMGSGMLDATSVGAHLAQSELPAEPERLPPVQRALARPPVLEQRSELELLPAFPEQAHSALRPVLVARAQRPELAAHRDCRMSDELPADRDFHLAGRRALGASRPSAGAGAVRASRSRPPTQRQRSGRPWEECPDERRLAPDGLWRRRPVARE